MARDAAAFWNGTADEYAKKPIRDEAAYRETLERTRKHLSSDHRALEIGCGTGTTALRLAPCLGHLTSTDIAPRMLEIAREKARAEGVENVRFEQATLFDIAPENAAFDAVLAFNILHLLDDLPATAERIRALIRPGGVFVSKTVCLAEQSRLWGWLLALMKPLGLAPPVRCITIAELEDAITGAGFEVVETGLLPASPPSRFVVARRL